MPKIGIVVPCYNEGKRLDSNKFARFLQNNSGVCFVFVNDGSSDDTEKILNRLAAKRSDQVLIVNLKDNQGKARAIYSGVSYILSHRNVDFIGYWDADLSTPLDDILTFADILKTSNHYQLICGSRIRKMGSEIERKCSRHYLGRAFATLVSLTLKLPIYDSQCGAKIMKKELAVRLFDQPLMSRWILDVELIARVILALGRQRAEKSIFEVPLQRWEDTAGSKLTFYDMIIALYDLFKIARILKKTEKPYREENENKR